MARLLFPLRLAAALLASAAATVAQAQAPPADQAFLERYCVDCHNAGDQSGKLRLDNLAALSSLPASTPTNAASATAWEKVLRKLELREMPPSGSPRPDEKGYTNTIARLTTSLDRLAANHPQPGRTETFRRLTRFEYQNAVRDLLGIQIDAATILPPDESSRGFDNITVTGLSPTLLTRYISAAQRVSRMAVGRTGSSPAAETIRVRPDLTQDVHIEGLPLGTRGGVLIPHTFPRDGEYEVQVRLMRDRNDNIESLKETHTLEFLSDRERVAQFTIAPPKAGENDQLVDANLKARFTATAGRHDIGVTFVAKGASLLESPRKPLNVHFNFYRHPRLGPAVCEVSIIGPISAETTAAGHSILDLDRPATTADEEPAARKLLTDIVRRAYRRPVTPEDLDRPMAFFREGAVEGGYDAGIESALASILVSPQFLFRIEQEPDHAAPGTAYRISDLELATRLSFFLWSSIPDDELVQLAQSGQLRKPDVLKQQIERMLKDERSNALVTNFAGQWLYLRNLETAIPDMRLFPDFDDNLRKAFRQETELFVGSILHEDRSVLDLIRSSDTFLNERLAKHYGVPNVYGSHFRRVGLDGQSHRGGLLRQGSVLTVTSYSTRTSPVIRGKWVLENILGSPPPPPPENVPALTDNTVNASLSVRERLAQHRAHAACASCHDRIDPIGLSLENFDAVGRWREREEGKPVDASGGLFPGRTVKGVEELEAALLEHPELFERTLAEKLLTYALGRGIEPTDGPALRQIVRDCQDSNNRFSALIAGIVNSAPFQMRISSP